MNRGSRPVPGRPHRSRLRSAVTGVSALLLLLAALSTPRLLEGPSLPAPGRPPGNGLARTPPMGWDTWNTYGCDIDQDIVERQADALVASGMRDAGYRVVIVDDCWFDPSRTSTGGLRASPTRFPSGVRALGDYLHARGLELGLYESPSARTCAQLAGAYPGSTGSLGHEVQDARRFAAWGVDYLKYDWCSPAGTTADQVRAFARMRDAIAATGRPIVLSINPNSAHATTGPQRSWGDVANLWRTTQDVTDSWTTGATGSPVGIDDILDANAPLAPLSAPGGFNDADMLEVGREGLTPDEQRSQLALWAMMASPLIAGNDVASQDAATRSLLTTRSLVAIDQDPLGRQAELVGEDSTSRVLSKPLSSGDLAVALVNEGSTTRELTVGAAALGLTGHDLTLTDAWTGKVTAGRRAVVVDVLPHATAVYLVAAS